MKKRDNPAENPDFKNPNSVELSLFCVGERNEKKLEPSRFLLEAGLVERRERL